MRLSRLLVLTVLALLVGFAGAARPAEAAPGDFYLWAKWRLGQAPYTCQPGAPWVRPNLRRRVPASWWERLASYDAAVCPEPPDFPVEPELLADVTLDAREQALREAVNAVRRRYGLAPLPIMTSLQRAARGHTADITQFHYFGHDWHNGTPFGIWVQRYTRCRTFGEILAWRSPQETPAHAVQQWLGSPSHRAALLSGSWSYMGVELTKKYATVEFGRNC